MIKLDDYITENKTEHNPKWPCVSDHPYRILITGGSGSGKTNALLHLIKNQPNIDKIYLCTKDPYKSNYQYLINKRKKVDLKHYNDRKSRKETQSINSF